MPDSRTQKKPNSAAPQPGEQRRGEQRRLHRQTPSLGHQQPRRIGAEAEVGGMAEADDAADADQEVQAEGGEREDQHLDRDLDAGRRRRPAAARSSDDASARRPAILLRPAEARELAGCPPAAPRAPRPPPAGPSGPRAAPPAPAAISRNTSTSVILGKTRMPKACSCADQQRGQEGAGHRAHAADHRHHEGLGDDREVHVRVGGDAWASAARRRGPPAPRRGTACR